MALDLATVTSAAFRPLLDAEIDVTLPEGSVVRATVCEVTDSKYPPPGRVAFSVILRVPTPAGEVPSQGTITLSHPALEGEMALFAVPIKRDGDAVLWQIIFG